MLFLIVFLCAVIVAAGLGLLSGWSDFRGMIIPNAYPVGIILAFAFAYAAVHFSGNPEPFQRLSSHITAGVGALVITFFMTMTKTMGGGDSKLITAYALWMGVLNIAWYLLVVTTLGALLALMALAIKRFKPFKNVRPGSWLARVQSGEAVVAYGIPIAAGAVYIFLTEQYVALETIKAFLVAPVLPEAG